MTMGETESVSESHSQSQSGWTVQWSVECGASEHTLILRYKLLLFQTLGTLV